METLQKASKQPWKCSSCSKTVKSTKWSPEACITDSPKNFEYRHRTWGYYM